MTVRTYIIKMVQTFLCVLSSMAQNAYAFRYLVALNTLCVLHIYALRSLCRLPVRTAWNIVLATKNVFFSGKVWRAGWSLTATLELENVILYTGLSEVFWGPWILLFPAWNLWKTVSSYICRFQVFHYGSLKRGRGQLMRLLHRVMQNINILPAHFSGPSCLTFERE